MSREPQWLELLFCKFIQLSVVCGQYEYAFVIKRNDIVTKLWRKKAKVTLVRLCKWDLQNCQKTNLNYPYNRAD